MLLSYRRRCQLSVCKALVDSFFVLFLFFRCFCAVEDVLLVFFDNSLDSFHQPRRLDELLFVWYMVTKVYHR